MVLKDLVTTGNTATQKRIAELAANTQKQVTDLALDLILIIPLATVTFPVTYID